MSSVVLVGFSLCVGWLCSRECVLALCACLPLVLTTRPDPTRRIARCAQHRGRVTARVIDPVPDVQPCGAHDGGATAGSHPRQGPRAAARHCGGHEPQGRAVHPRGTASRIPTCRCYCCCRCWCCCCFCTCCCCRCRCHCLCRCCCCCCCCCWCCCYCHCCHCSYCSCCSSCVSAVVVLWRACVMRWECTC
jgi:hypothetical protein